jgi:hypothetical protein
MKLRATGFILLVIWTNMGIVKNGGDFESLQECKEFWADQVACWKEELKNPRGKDWGQPLGFCLQGERLSAPGIIFPPKEDDKTRNTGCG